MTNTSNRKTVTEKAITAFKSGRDFTTKQLAARLGVTPRKVTTIVNDLRLDGYAIYKNNRKNAGYFGNLELTSYRLGTPSRSMVSAAALYSGADIFQTR